MAYVSISEYREDVLRGHPPPPPSLLVRKVPPRGEEKTYGLDSCPIEIRQNENNDYTTKYIGEGDSTWSKFDKEMWTNRQIDVPQATQKSKGLLPIVSKSTWTFLLGEWPHYYVFPSPL